MPSTIDWATRIRPILVNGRQTVHGDGMGSGDCQLVIPVIEQSPAQQTNVDLKVVSPEAALDRDLPQDGRTIQ